MATCLGTKERACAPLVDVAQDLVPADHYYRQREWTLDRACVRDVVKDCCAAATHYPAAPASSQKRPSPLKKGTLGR